MRPEKILPLTTQGRKWACDRCGEEGTALTGSYFDTSLICPRCEDVEKAHPKYAEAVTVETEAVKNGDYNFPGIGVPEGLIERCRQARADADATQDLLISD